jgi:hypothetical protein
MNKLEMKLNSYYRTRRGERVKIINTRGEYFLGLGISKIPFTYWYNKQGRLYSDSISPDDIEQEIATKLEFNTTVQKEEDKFRITWPKAKYLKDLAGSKVKITIELLDE